VTIVLQEAFFTMLFFSLLVLIAQVSSTSVPTVLTYDTTNQYYGAACEFYYDACAADANCIASDNYAYAVMQGMGLADPTMGAIDAALVPLYSTASFMGQGLIDGTAIPNMKLEDMYRCQADLVGLNYYASTGCWATFSACLADEDCVEAAIAVTKCGKDKGVRFMQLSIYDVPDIMTPDAMTEDMFCDLWDCGVEHWNDLYAAQANCVAYTMTDFDGKDCYDRAVETATAEFMGIFKTAVFGGIGGSIVLTSIVAAVLAYCGYCPSKQQ